MAGIVSVSKVGNLLEITYDDGAVTRKTIAYENVVTSVPPSGSSQVGVVYVNASGQLVIQYDSSTLTITSGGTLTGAEIVALLEALGVGSRLSHSKLDDVGANDHHIRYTDTEAVTAVKADSDIADAITKKHTQNTDSDLSPAHKDVATGVHGVGSGTVAKVGDAITFALALGG